jgi:hypothetical protein
VAPTILVEFHDRSLIDANRNLEATKEIAAKTGSTSFRHATDSAERDELWRARKGAYFASLRSRAAKGGRMVILVTDVCVPLTALADCISETEADFKVAATLRAPIHHPRACAGEQGRLHLQHRGPCRRRQLPRLCAVCAHGPGRGGGATRAGPTHALPRHSHGRCCVWSARGAPYAPLRVANPQLAGEHGVGMGKMEGLREVRVHAARLVCNADRVCDAKLGARPRGHGGVQDAEASAGSAGDFEPGQAVCVMSEYCAR